MSCERTGDAGAWVLGALPEDEAERFRAHLADCAACRREVAELQIVADTLPLAAVQVAPPPELKGRIMSAVRAEADVLAAAGPEADVARAPGAGDVARAPGAADIGRAPGGADVAVPSEAAAAEPGAPARPRREKRPREGAWFRRPLLALRPLPAAFAAAVLIALGVGVGTLLSSGASERTVRAQVVVPSAPTARASLTIRGDDRATLTVRNFPSPPRGRVYQLWRKRPGSAAPEPTDALFDVRNGSATVDVPGGVEGVDQVLVTDEPNGGSAAPTRSPVVIAQSA
jgi:anti-sigma factor RsiW